jgi:hypothetical protein
MLNVCIVLCLFAANVLRLFGTNIVDIAPQASPSYIPLCYFNPFCIPIGFTLCILFFRWSTKNIYAPVPTAASLADLAFVYPA